MLFENAEPYGGYTFDLYTWLVACAVLFSFNTTALPCEYVVVQFDSAAS